MQLRFRDNFFRFWSTFVLPLRHVAELRGPEEEAAVEPRLGVYAGRVFGESLVAELVLRLASAGVVGVRPVEAGPWWRGGAEIDYVIREPGRAEAFSRRSGRRSLCAGLGACSRASRRGPGPRG